MNRIRDEEKRRWRPERRAAGAPDHVPMRLHVARTVALSLPIVVARAAMLVMFMVDTFFTGWAGARELAYLGLGVAPQLTLMLIGIGMLTATIVLVAQSFGAGDLARCGRILRASIVHAMLLGLVIFALSFLAEPFFLATGQEPEIARGAARVTFAFALGIPGLLLYITVNQFLEATGRPRVGMTVMIVINLLNIPLNGLFALGWGGLFPPAGALGAVGASSALRWCALAAVSLYTLASAFRRDDPFAILLPWPAWRAEIASLGGDLGRRLRRLGLPMGLAQGVESAAFATIVLIAGWLGTAALAAHQLTMVLITFTFMTAIGVSGATAIRVGRAIGRRDREDIARAGWIGIAVGASFAMPYAVLFALFSRQIAEIFVADPAVIAIARRTIATASLILVFDAMMAVAMGALRGLGDVWMALALQACAFWITMVPAALLFAIRLDLGPVGLLYGILAGILASLALLLPRFHIVSQRPPEPLQ